MGDFKTLAKARMELEEFYSGVPDDSVNLTFQDLAIHVSVSSFLPLCIKHFYILPRDGQDEKMEILGGRDKDTGLSIFNREFDGVSVMSMNSMYQERPRRPGIPHSNICIVCSPYIYTFQHRCSVCGRFHCRNCVIIGMGEMTEGRKCLDCLGRRFSQRYISRAGMVGCCSGHPGTVKQAELKWAEKGSRGESIYSIMTSRSGGHMTPPIGTKQTRKIHSKLNCMSFKLNMFLSC